MADFTQLPPMDGAVLRNRGHGVSRDVAAVGAALWRRKWIPMTGMLLGLGIGIAAMAVMPPLYKASVRIMVDDKESRNGVIESEVAIAQSTPVFNKVAGTLALYRDPYFRAPTIFDRISGDANDENDVRDRVMRRLQRVIGVRVLPHTSIIDMTVHHPNPDRAAQIANGLLAAYQERKVDERFEQSRQISNWMSKQLESIRADSQDAKQRLLDYQTTHAADIYGGAGVQTQRMTMLAHDMAEAQNEIQTLSARLETAQKQGGKGGGMHAARLRELKNSEGALAAEYGRMKTRYGDLHPKMIEMRAKLARIRADISVEAKSSPAVLGQDLNNAKMRVDSLQSQIDAISSSADSGVRAKIDLKNLEDEVAANERLYADFLVKYQDMTANTELGGVGIKVISMATIPSRPDQAARFTTLIALALLGFLLGLFAALMRIIWATGFTTAEQLEAMTGYPVFAAIPMASKHSDAAAVHHNVIQDPAAILAESLRSLRVSLRLRGETGKRPRVVAFTSTLPDEGKTSMAVMLAMIAAKSGERVCVVDCDLRKPSLHKAFGIGNARGVADYLSDRLGIDDVIYRKDPSGVHLITAKSVPSYSLTLLTSGRMERLIENLREQYDLVILDAPSSLAFADARVLARMVDQTLYVVAWNRTRRESVLASLKAYADLGYAHLALVLNKVDLAEYLRDSAAAVVYQYGRNQQDGSDPVYVT